MPRQHSSEGKDVLLGISKRGDRYLRSLLVHGARSVVIQAGKQDGANRLCDIGPQDGLPGSMKGIVMPMGEI